MSKYIQPSSSSCSKGSSAGGVGKYVVAGSNCFACPRLIPYPVAINTLGSVELESSEVNPIGKVGKAGHLAIIKPFVLFFKRPKCRMMLSFDSVIQEKAPALPVQLSHPHNLLVSPVASTVKEFQSQVSSEQSQNFVLVN